MKHKNVEVDQRVIIKRSTSTVWDTAARHIGKEFTVSYVEPLSYIGEGTVMVGNSDSSVLFWCNHRDLELYVEGELPWPWPKGTPVDMTARGRGHIEEYLRIRKLPMDTPLFLGSDGSNIPPIETADGKYICYVDATNVKRK